MKKENDIFEKTLDIAESGYDNAYQFLLDAYKNAPENYRNGMFSVYDPLALTIRDSWSFIGNSGGSYREEQGLSGPKHRKYGNCGGRISESVRQQACFWGMHFQNSWK